MDDCDRLEDDTDLSRRIACLHAERDQLRAELDEAQAENRRLKIALEGVKALAEHGLS